jgi:hypothetical protein
LRAAGVGRLGFFEAEFHGDSRELRRKQWR